MVARRLILASIGSFFVSPQVGRSEMLVDTIPPTRYWDWDIRNEGSTLSREFRISEDHVYKLGLDFKFSGSTDMARLRQFTGDHSYWIYDNSLTPPKKITPKTAEEVIDANKKIQEGKYILKNANGGTAIFFNLQVFKILHPNTTPHDRGKVLFDERVQTEGIVSGGNGMFVRLIKSITMTRGYYAMTLRALSENLVPSDVTTSVSLSEWY